MKNFKVVSLLLILFVILANGCNLVNPPMVPSPAGSNTESPVIAMSSPTPHGKSLTVTSTNDTGSGTLRQAMQDALPGDTITFDTTIFPPNAPVAINPLFPLPELSQGSITIDASNAGVILDGVTITGGADGLTITSNGNTIMGLQVIGFAGNGISLQNAAQKNSIGGDRNIGDGQLGQGNLLSGNKERGIVLGGDSAFNLITGNFIGTDVSGTLDYGNGMDGLHMNGASDNQVLNNLISGNDGHGMDLCCSETTRKNTISKNLIGTDITGTAVLGNFGSGIALHDGANHNVIGPENLIAFNGGNGIEVGNPATLSNTISQNSILDNKGLSINLWDGGNEVLAAPNIFDIDAGAGTVTGWACSDCIVEFFSDRDGQNPYYEGQVKTDNTGNFAFSKGKAFNSPVLFASATDNNGNSSKFSLSTTGINRTLVMQTGNSLPKFPIKPLRSGDLMDNGIGVNLGWSPDCTQEYITSEFLDMGAKRVKVAVSELEPESILGEGTATIDWSRPELSITPNQESCIETYLKNGVSITYILSFWDKANHPDGWQPQVSRFQTQDEIDRYLEYVRFIVHHFKGRIEYYEMWNEPNNKPPLQWIQAADYINLVKQTIPVIHQEDPEAKIVIGGIVLQQPEDRDFLFKLLESELMPLVDVVSWHAMFGVSPKNNAEYYNGYPDLVQSIKDTSASHGFKGEYWGDELLWRSIDCYWCYPGDPLDSNIVAAKYHLRGILIHLGLGLKAQVTGNSSIRVDSYTAIRNLSTIMAGTSPINLPIEIQGEIGHTGSYAFSLPNGDKYLAIWNDNIAVDEDPGIPMTIKITGYSNWQAKGIDTLLGYEQNLLTKDENGDLIIEGLLIKDYPIIIHLSK